VFEAEASLGAMWSWYTRFACAGCRDFHIKDLVPCCDTPLHCRRATCITAHLLLEVLGGRDLNLLRGQHQQDSSSSREVSGSRGDQEE